MRLHNERSFDFYEAGKQDQIDSEFNLKGQGTHSIWNQFVGLNDEIACFQWLKTNFDRIKKQYMKEIYLSDLELPFMDKMISLRAASHFKLLFCEVDHSIGHLKVELMVFSGQCATKIHNHQDFILDEILDGALVERIYSNEQVQSRIDHEQVQSRIDHEHRNLSLLKSSPSYQKKIERYMGEMRFIDARPGLFHDVCAIGGPCKVFSISFNPNSK